MIAGGVTVVEVTMTVPGAIDLLKELKKEYGAKLLLGSGTVTTADQAEATIDAGAEFVVSPSFHPEVIDVTKSEQKDLHSRRAHAHRGHHRLECRRGLREDFSLLGRGRRKLSEVAAGAVSASQADSHRRRHAGNRGELYQGRRARLGVGSDLVNLAAIDAGHPETITETARAYLKILADTRNN